MVSSGAGFCGAAGFWSLKSSLVSFASAWVSVSDIFFLPRKTSEHGSLLVLAPPHANDQLRFRSTPGWLPAHGGAHPPGGVCFSSSFLRCQAGESDPVPSFSSPFSVMLAPSGLISGSIQISVFCSRDVICASLL